MKRTVSIKLVPTPEQAQALSELQSELAKACNLIVPFARDNRCWNRVALHHLAYYPVREATNLGSQMVCNAIKAVADAYKVLKLKKSDDIPAIRFRETGSVHFDAWTYRLKDDAVSLYTLRGRTVVKMSPGEFQSQYLAVGKPKEGKLVRRGKQWFFNLPAYSSKTCSACGCLGSRIQHTFSCSSCAHLAHSDRNAAVNLAKLAKSIGIARPEVAPAHVAVPTH